VLVVRLQARRDRRHVAAGLSVGTVVPSGPVWSPPRGLAVLRRAGAVVVPDFVSTAGRCSPAGPSPGPEIRTAASVAIDASLLEVLGHDDARCWAPATGPRRSSTWRDTLPFGVRWPEPHRSADDSVGRRRL
jgi:hypothetical protein